ncbi:Sec-independent protein translocase protein TatA [Pontiella desulfatans]|uniref:Sec-independent protein translocase protein TatA n=1 Tax=Pontiella desulfatans TaxID=2750659 RepID=A0A6C2U379_PONDE|nr:twin-arginine translocase TatA/TatE family subunit [Pontiella desulfatans]VGO13816.1 Sec-independent protein translocase protein TatA [Pontiella desulfatans]
MNAIAYFGLPGGSEVILILFIILLLFGAKKLPELSRSLGKSLGEFKKGKEDLERELRDVQKDLHKAATEPEPEVKKDATAEEVVADAAPAKDQEPKV